MYRRMRNRKHAAATRQRKKESMVQMLEELAQLRKVDLVHVGIYVRVRLYESAAKYASCTVCATTTNLSLPCPLRCALRSTPPCYNSRLVGLSGAFSCVCIVLLYTQNACCTFPLKFIYSRAISIDSDHLF